MGVIFILVSVSLLFAGGFLAAFIWSVRTGQYDDTTTPSLRMLMEEAEGSKEKIPLVKKIQNHER